MKRNPLSGYEKHIYWLKPSQARQFLREMASKGTKVRSAKGVVCAPLDPLTRIASVAPEVWNDTCSRQGSWYRTSERNGLHLIVSSFELEGLEDSKAATISESSFKPPRLATREDKKALSESPELLGRLPSEWSRVHESHKKIYLRWAERLGSNAQDFDSLYLSHTANHANFISPRFFTRDGEGIIPYSIDRSAHLCSCCVELFQVLGSYYKKKLVAPCAGAVIFARLKPDRYLLVEKG
jgi:hypothetical protein